MALHRTLYGTNMFKSNVSWDLRGRDRMVVGFIITYAISAYHN